MYKILLVFLLAVVFLGFYAVQLDEEAAVQVFFQLKHGVNRAAHAAAQQVDLQQLADGTVEFDRIQAQEAAAQYLQRNLMLNEKFESQDDSFVQGKVNIEVLEFIDSSHRFPYRYVNDDYDYAVTLHKPGVIMIIHAQYNRLFSAIGPISWHVKGAAEIVR